MDLPVDFVLTETAVLRKQLPLDCPEGRRPPQIESQAVANVGAFLDVNSSSRRNISFCGRVPNEVLPNYFYRGADLFLTCSESETFGITILEALGCDLLPILPRRSPVFREFYEKALGRFMFDGAEDLERVLCEVSESVVSTSSKDPGGSAAGLEHPEAGDEEGGGVL